MQTLLNFSQLSPVVWPDAIRNVCIQEQYFAYQKLFAFQSLSLDNRVNNGALFASVVRSRMVSRRLRDDFGYARQFIESNLMHFNALGHSYSYTLKRFFH